MPVLVPHLVRPRPAHPRGRQLAASLLCGILLLVGPISSAQAAPGKTGRAAVMERVERARLTGDEDALAALRKELAAALAAAPSSAAPTAEGTGEALDVSDSPNIDAADESSIGDEQTEDAPEEAAPRSAGAETRSDG